MNFVKTYWGKEGNIILSIRTNYYSHDLEYIQTLIAELRKDLPHEVLDKDISITIYNTPSFKGMMGIEYCTRSIPNEEYFELDVAPCKF